MPIQQKVCILGCKATRSFWHAEAIFPTVCLDLALAWTFADLHFLIG